ncbi:MAG: TlpA disulfide reductase family protein, partial [Pseudomonadota bacterium]
LPNLDEQPTSLSDFQGQPLLVNFWATWCRPCRKEIPLLIELRDTHADARLEIVGIAIDELEVTREMASAFEIDYPVIVGEQEGIDAMVAFGAPTTALPFTAAVDRDGLIVGGHVGELTPEDADRLLQLIL